MGQPDFDTFDRKILAILQTDNRITAQNLAKRVGLSPAACQKRLKRLRNSGVIAAEVAVLSPEMLGPSVTLVVQVLVTRDDTEELDRFKSSMLAAPEVMQCYYVTGEQNFTLVVVLPDMATYEAFSRRHFISNPDVSRFTTSVVMDRVKTGHLLHIEPGEWRSDPSPGS